MVSLEKTHARRGSPPPRRNKSSPFRDAAAGALAGATSKTITAPIERVKLLLQLQASSRAVPEYRSAFDAASRVYREQGLMSFWRGNLPNVMRHIGATGLTFSVKDRFKQVFAPPRSARRRERLAAAFLSGGAAGAGTGQSRMRSS